MYQGKALAKLVQRYKWTQVSTITTIDQYSEELARKFAVEVRQLGVDITTEQRFEAHTKASIKEHLKEVGNIFIEWRSFRQRGFVRSPRAPKLSSRFLH